MAPPTPTPTLTRRPAGTDDGAPRVKEPRRGAFARAVRRNLTAHAFLIEIGRAHV